MKAERTQDNILPVPPDRRQRPRREAEGWTVDTQTIAISRHFPFSDYTAAAVFLMQIARLIDQHDPEQDCPAAAITVDPTGLTIRLGNAPEVGVTAADFDLAEVLSKAA